MHREKLIMTLAKARRDRVLALAATGRYTQVQIASAVGLTQARVSQLLIASSGAAKSGRTNRRRMLRLMRRNEHEQEAVA